MHEHDFDLIAAIAEGSAARGSEAVLTGCTVCREELALQREAIAALKTAPFPVMSDLERARLHRGISAAFAPAKRVAPWYQRLVPVMAAAAALLVVVGVGSLLTRGGGESAESFSEIGAALSDSAPRPAAEGGAESDETPGESQALEMATTTAAAAEGALPAEAPSLFDFGTMTEQELTERARSYLRDTAVAQAEDPATSVQYSDLRCVRAAVERAAGMDPDRVAVATVDGQAVEVYFFPAFAQVFETDTCRPSATID